MIVLNENIKGLKVGTKMIGNWGAMIPLSYGTVTDVIRDYKGVDVEVTIDCLLYTSPSPRDRG